MVEDFPSLLILKNDAFVTSSVYFPEMIDIKWSIFHNQVFEVGLCIDLIRVKHSSADSYFN